LPTISSNDDHINALPKKDILKYANTKNCIYGLID